MDGSRPHVIIVGAGISGLAVAALLAGAPADVTVLEQVIPPGRKPGFAGIVSASDLRVLGLELDPLSTLPVRGIAHVNPDTGLRSTQPAPDGWVTIEHRRLLGLLKASIGARGVAVMPDATVTGFTWLDGVVAGVRNEETGVAYPADLIVLADESNPRLAESLGLRPDWSPPELMHVGKRRYAADPATLRDRLGGDGDGITVLSLEHPASWGSPGWDVVVPAPDAITVASAMSLEEAMVSARHISEYLDEIERDTPVREVVAGLHEEAFMTEVVPVGGFDVRHAFQTDRVLVVNDLVGLTHPLNRDGLSANLAVCRAAARAIIQAIDRNDFSDKTLRTYSAAIADEVVTPANAARRTDKSLRAQPPWLWAAKAKLFVPGSGMTAWPKPATLGAPGERGAWRRIRSWGRMAGVRRHAPGEYDE